MSSDLPRRKCPFCRDDAYVAEVEIEAEFPEDRLEIRCLRCGDFHLLSKEVSLSHESADIKGITGKELDTGAISRVNLYAHSEGKTVLWLTAFDSVNKWEKIVENYSHHYGGIRPYEVRVILDFIVG